MSGRPSRSKGQRGEREVVALIRTHLGIQCHRGTQTRGGIEEADVVGLEGWHVECKRCETTNLYAWLKQSETDAHEGEVPTVVFRKNGQPWRIVFGFVEFLEMLGKIRGNCET